jgi:hypothetical protein
MGGNPNALLLPKVVGNRGYRSLACLSLLELVTALQGS